MQKMAVQARTVQAAISENRTWFIILGVLLIILGIAAISFPLLTTIAAKIFLGWLFLIGGIVQIVHAFSTRQWSEFFLDLLIGALYLIVGGWLAFWIGVANVVGILAYAGTAALVMWLDEVYEDEGDGSSDGFDDEDAQELATQVVLALAVAAPVSPNAPLTHEGSAR
jgi:uncharacterized membrane protein HdeD (DUF308 family)